MATAPKLRNQLNIKTEKGSGIANFALTSFDANGNIVPTSSSADVGSFPIISKSEPSWKVDYPTAEDEYETVYHLKGKEDGTIKFTYIQQDASSRKLMYSTLKDQKVSVLKEENKQTVAGKNLYRYYPCLMPNESMGEKRPGKEFDYEFFILKSPNAHSVNLGIFSTDMAATLTSITIDAGTAWVDIEI